MHDVLDSIPGISIKVNEWMNQSINNFPPQKIKIKVKKAIEIKELKHNPVTLPIKL